ncbi:MAG: alkaline phosphatase family protein [Polyangia bacterium]
MASTRSYSLLLVVCSLLAAGLCGVAGSTWSDRLSSHRGFYQVTATPNAPSPPLALPRTRRTVVVVLDGLSYRDAQGLGALESLAASGQCRKTYVGSMSMSRPMYAVISTGLEADRTGSRGNDDTSPLAAESIWDVAQQAGLSVSAVSELPWWHELFPRGFSRYDVRPRPENYFAQMVPADVQLVHTVYIDETAHDFGARSPEFQAAVRRADRELWGLLGTLDLSRDLLLVTADHGHSLRGGHGGQQERVAHVQTCFAGPRVQRRGTGGTLRSTSIAPALAVLLGLRFPAQLRAGAGPGGLPDDELEVLWQIVDPAGFPPGYLDQRRAELERFRAENRQQLLRWLPQSDGTWTAFYEHAQRQQARRWLLCAAAVGLVLALQAAAQLRLLRAHKKRWPVLQALLSVGWLGSVWALGFGLQVLLRGSFDLTSTNHREEFIHFTCALGALCGTTAVLVHIAWRRSLRALMLDLSALLGTSALAAAAHPFVLGWKLGFPIPRPELMFFPYFAALFVGCLAGLGVAVALIGWVHGEPRRRRPLPTAP